MVGGRVRTGVACAAKRRRIEMSGMVEHLHSRVQDERRILHGQSTAICFNGAAAFPAVLLASSQLVKYELFPDLKRRAPPLCNVAKHRCTPSSVCAAE